LTPPSLRPLVPTLTLVTENWTRGPESLLDGPSPAVLTTYRQDGSAVASPVWFR